LKKEEDDEPEIKAEGEPSAAPVKEDEAEAGSSKPGIDEGDKAAAADAALIDPDELLKVSRSCHVMSRQGAFHTGMTCRHRKFRHAQEFFNDVRDVDRDNEVNR